jgi:hypothetical protein
MPRFKDALEREWLVRIKYSDLPSLREVGCDLDKLCEGDGTRFFDAYIALPLPVKVAALWELVRKQRPDVNEASFADGFDGDALQAGMTAFMEGVVDFFRQPKTVSLWANRLRINEAESSVLQKQIDHKLSILSGLDGASLERLASTLPG